MIPATNFEFPNGYSAMFGAERFKIPEPLFDPIGTNLRILGGKGMFATYVNFGPLLYEFSLHTLQQYFIT